MKIHPEIKANFITSRITLQTTLTEIDAMERSFSKWLPRTKFWLVLLIYLPAVFILGLKNKDVDCLLFDSSQSIIDSVSFAIILSGLVTGLGALLAKLLTQNLDRTRHDCEVALKRLEKMTTVSKEALLVGPVRSWDFGRCQRILDHILCCVAEEAIQNESKQKDSVAQFEALRGKATLNELYNLSEPLFALGIPPAQRLKAASKAFSISSKPGTSNTD